ncbi:MAG: RIP metalloprotease RseP [Proteobacteria bacterium]|nr:RIP metalloprotease RseP [Pseudomonadota bacterium]
MAVLYIVILIGVLVFVHEFGHFLAARFFGVKVLSFSIGFGPKLLSLKRGDTSWDIRILPLGGFVQMYGSEFEEVSNPDAPDFARAYNNKPIWQKAIINLAGPLSNLLLPIPILFAVYFATVTQDLPPTIGQVLDNSPALGVLEPGDRVTHINGKPVQFWTTLQATITANPDTPLLMTIERDGTSLQATITPEKTIRRDSLDILTQTIGRIGVTPDLAGPVVGVTTPMGKAAIAGFKTFDEIVAVNGNPIRSFVELEQAIRHNDTATLTFDILRPTPAEINFGSLNILVPASVVITHPADSLEALGLASANMFISEVDNSSPAQRAGLKAGDQILALNGLSVNLFRSFIDKLAQTWENPHELTVRRNGEVFTTTIQLEKLTITGEFQEEVPIIYAGFYHKVLTVQPDLVDKTMTDRLAYAARISVTRTVEASSMLVVYIVRMFQGRVSTKSLGGPIMIGHMASKAGQDGIEAFLRMLAIISINLGILNLLPIPLLDGGKLAILGVEAIKRGPLTMRTRQIIAYVGLAMVGLLMMLAFKNDLERLWNMIFS